MKNFYLSLLLSLFIIGSANAQLPVMNPIAGPSVVCAAPSGPVSYTATASNSPTSFNWTILPSASSTVSPGTGSVCTVSFPPSNGTYTIICYATNTLGVGSPVTKVVQVYETPNVTFSGATSFCQGSSTSIQASSTMLMASPTISYSWTPPSGLNTTIGPNVIAFPASSMVYSCTATKGPCSNTATLAITVLPLPTFSVTSNPTLACLGQSVAISMNGTSVSYTFNGSPITGNTVAVTPTVTTTYTIGGITSAGCKGSTAFTQSVGCIGIMDPKPADHQVLIVYPNPAQGQFNLSSGYDEIVFIYNELGQLTRTLTLHANEKISITDLRPGIYFVTSERIRIKVIVTE
jgi:hypothetical protein